MAEPFDEETKLQAWIRSEGRCECTRKGHGHIIRCTQMLDYDHTHREGDDAWETHHINSNGPSVYSNCEILCWPCHSLTF